MRFCLLAAGRGARCTAIPGLHKGLWPIGGRAVISRLLDAVPRNIEIVVALGHLGDQVRAFMEVCHGDRTLTFIKVDGYDAPGSGPGASLLACRRALAGAPFVFAPCDALLDSIPYLTFPAQPRAWVGVGRDSNQTSVNHAAYVRRRDDGTFYYPDPSRPTADGRIFAGLACVVDGERYFDELAASELVRGERQTWAALPADAASVEVACWRDVGNDADYLAARTRHVDPTPRKGGQELFLEGERVVKFFTESGHASRLAERGRHVPGAAPMACVHPTLLVGERVRGKLLADVPDRDVFAAFLDFYWREYIEPRSNTRAEEWARPEDWTGALEAMHREKVRTRAEKMLAREPDLDTLRINGERVAPALELLDRVDYAGLLRCSRPGPFHGDLQPENVIVRRDGGFALLDWRTDFGGLPYGDSVYDLGKLLHALVLGDAARRGGYSVTIKRGRARVELRARAHLLGHASMLLGWAGAAREAVLLAAVLQLLNISPLYPDHDRGDYGRLLFLYGKLMLHRWLLGSRILLELL